MPRSFRSPADAARLSVGNGWVCEAHHLLKTI